MGQHGSDTKEAVNSEKIRIMSEVLNAAGEMNLKTEKDDLRSPQKKSTGTR